MNIDLNVFLLANYGIDLFEFYRLAKNINFIHKTNKEDSSFFFFLLERNCLMMIQSFCDIRDMSNVLYNGISLVSLEQAILEVHLVNKTINIGDIIELNHVNKFINITHYHLVLLFNLVYTLNTIFLKIIKKKLKYIMYDLLRKTLNSKLKNRKKINVLKKNIFFNKRVLKNVGNEDYYLIIKKRNLFYLVKRTFLFINIIKSPKSKSLLFLGFNNNNYYKNLFFYNNSIELSI
jgi:hypothetical protein